MFSSRWHWSTSVLVLYPTLAFHISAGWRRMSCVSYKGEHLLCHKVVLSPSTNLWGNVVGNGVPDPWNSRNVLCSQLLLAVQLPEVGVAWAWKLDGAFVGFFYPNNGDWKTSRASPLYLHLYLGLATEHTYHSGKDTSVVPILRFADKVLCNPSLCSSFFCGLMLALWGRREAAWLCDFFYLATPQCFSHAQGTGFSHSAYGPLPEECS